MKTILLLLLAVSIKAANVATEYARVVDGVVVQVIVASASHIATRHDGTWVLTPYDPATGMGRVLVGYEYHDSKFWIENDDDTETEVTSQ